MISVNKTRKDHDPSWFFIKNTFIQLSVLARWTIGTRLMGVPVDCYTDVLVNVEANLDEEGAFQLKYYARGVGEVRIGWRGVDPTREELQLVEYKQLSPQELAKVHTQALGWRNMLLR